MEFEPGLVRGCPDPKCGCCSPRCGCFGPRCGSGLLVLLVISSPYWSSHINRWVSWKILVVLVPTPSQI
jgi:hypothetical protein